MIRRANSADMFVATRTASGGTEAWRWVLPAALLWGLALWLVVWVWAINVAAYNGVSRRCVVPGLSSASPSRLHTVLDHISFVCTVAGHFVGTS
jgi:hypothetical protein